MQMWAIAYGGGGGLERLGEREVRREGCKGEWQMSLYCTYERVMPVCDLTVKKGFTMLMQVHSSIQAELICAAHWTFTFYPLTEGHHWLHGDKSTDLPLFMCMCGNGSAFFSVCVCHVCVFQSCSSMSADCIVLVEQSAGCSPDLTGAGGSITGESSTAPTHYRQLNKGYQLQCSSVQLFWKNTDIR